MLRQDSTGETPGMVIDELRIGLTWADVTPLEPVASVKDKSIKGFATYPNPVSNGYLSVKTASSSQKEVLIYSVLGKKVFALKFSGTSRVLDVSGINAGIYIMKVIEGNKIATKKLVIR